MKREKSHTELKANGCVLHGETLDILNIRGLYSTYNQENGNHN